MAAERKPIFLIMSEVALVRVVDRRRVPGQWAVEPADNRIAPVLLRQKLVFGDYCLSG